MRRRRETIKNEGYDFHVVGGARLGLRDLYHALLRVPWWAALVTIVAGYLVLNALFALAYLWVGGVANAGEGSYVDAFFFSVQTMGTIGYGSMYPTTRLANALVVAESVVGLVVTALSTGLIFAKFSLVRPRVVFSARVAIGPMDGVPTLAIRIGNERRNRIVDSLFRLTLMRTTKTAEGVPMYLSKDLALVRERAPALSRSWTILHRIEPGSPLYGDTPETLEAGEVELTVQVIGTDDTSLQPVHANRTWIAKSIVFGARLKDVLSELPDGNLLLDLTQFHELEATRATAEFPYGVKAEATGS